MAITIAAWTDQQGQIRTASSQDGLTWGNFKVVMEQTPDQPIEVPFETHAGPSVTFHNGKYYLAAIRGKHEQGKHEQGKPQQGKLCIFALEAAGKGEENQWKFLTEVSPQEHHSAYGPSLASDGVNLVLSWIGQVRDALNIMLSPNGIEWNVKTHNWVGDEALSKYPPALSTTPSMLPQQGSKQG